VGYECDFPNLLSSWSDKLHPDDFDRVITAFAAHLNDRTGKIPYSLEYQLRLKSGEYRWFYAGGETLRDKNGVPLRVADTLKDITKKKIKLQLEKECEKCSLALLNNNEFTRIIFYNITNKGFCIVQ